MNGNRMAKFRCQQNFRSEYSNSGTKTDIATSHTDVILTYCNFEASQILSSNFSTFPPTGKPPCSSNPGQKAALLRPISTEPRWGLAVALRMNTVSVRTPFQRGF